MTKNALWIAVGMVAWSAALAATLSIAQSHGDWGHAICGPWGCGPPLQALVSCHLSWLIVLAPPAILLHRSGRVSSGTTQRFGVLLSVASIIGLMLIVVFERLTWWPMVGEWQRGYFWHRCAFEVVTMVDLPTLQLFALGIYLGIRRPDRLPIQDSRLTVQ